MIRSCLYKDGYFRLVSSVPIYYPTSPFVIYALNTQQVNQPLLLYRYTPTSLSWRVHRVTLLRLRVWHMERMLFGLLREKEGEEREEEKEGKKEELKNQKEKRKEEKKEKQYSRDLSKIVDMHSMASAHDWTQGFSIWNAGRDGKRIYCEMSPRVRDAVTAFYDIDERKIGRVMQAFANGCIRHVKSAYYMHTIHEYT